MTKNILNTIKPRNYSKWILMLFVLSAGTGCIETFEPSTQTFENILVVEANITDELKQQKVLLSRTTPLEDKGVSPEGNASVTVRDGSGNEFIFQETTPGTYLSQAPFSAEPNTDYRLLIQTADGKSYTSTDTSISGTARIDEVRAVRTFNDNGIDGVEIRVDGSGTGGEASFFRYEFEETYQIVPPLSITVDLVVVSEDPPLLGTVLKTREESRCFKTENSGTIVLGNTGNLSESRIENLPVHFVASDNSILRTRYSILVKQLVLSREAYSFYETLTDISDLESLFAQSQSGFVEGNISSVENPEENVLGIFEVSSVSTERIFFDFRDIFPEVNRPPYFASCDPEANFLSVPPSPNREDFIRVKALLDQGYKLLSIEESFFGEVAFYTIGPRACVDCTAIGSNVVPDFWEE